MTNIDKTEIGPVQWIFKQHEDTNHMYDTYLPYSFHLRMVTNAAKDYIHLLPKNLQHSALLAAWGHDLIEDTRVSYNDVKNELGYDAAEIVYAVSNEKGKTRKERANDKYYKGICDTPGAAFVKLCDRIANVQYSKMTKSRQFGMYKDENENFTNSLKNYTGGDLEELFNYLNSLFND
jgi:(p)ppGpp synthase/HD superfamily hydrolase